MMANLAATEPVRQHRRYVAVIGPGDASGELCDLAYAVGAEVAKRQAILLCGGLTGVMEAAARGARESDPPGRSIGLLPGTDRRAGSQYLDYALSTGLEEARDVRAGDQRGRGDRRRLQSGDADRDRLCAAAQTSARGARRLVGSG